MAALQVKEDAATGQLTLSSPLTSRLGSLVFGLLWIIFIAVVFLAPILSSAGVDWVNLVFVLVVLVFSGGPALWSSLTMTTVTLDRSSRTLTSTLKLLVFPLRSITLSFADLANVETQYYRQSSGRASHDAWRVLAVDKSGKRIPINWDGKQSEMVDLAQKIAALTGAPFLDNSEKPARRFGMPMPPATAQPTGGTDVFNPDETLQPIDQTSASDQSAAPPPSASPMPADTSAPPAAAPWAMPMNELEQPQASVDGSIDTAPAPAVDLSTLSIGDLEKRAQADPLDSDARYMLARKYQAQGQLDRAITLYQETMRLDPSNSGAQNDLGVALQRRGKRAEAEAAYRRALALDPFFSTAHLNLGLLLRDTKRAADASQEFFQARQNARGDAETRAAEAASTGAKMEPRLSNMA